MHGSPKYANDRLWPKADIRTESKRGFLNVRFGEESGRSNPSDLSLGSTMSSESGEISVPARAIAHRAPYRDDPRFEALVEKYGRR